MKTTLLQRTLKSALLASAGAAILAAPAFAQPAAAPAAPATPVAADAGEEVTVTGSRLPKRDFTATSPITSVTGEQTTANADITLDTYLNTLPQVNPAGGTTSNNPGNGGQANVDLRGLGPNRNLVLIDGRRPMVSATDQSVDLNTIPQALIERIEVITGGAGATYGADAIAGVVNVILKKNFEGVDLRASYANTSNWDASEYEFQATVGGNFADGKGNAVLTIDRAVREQLIKDQRDFARFATSTTTNSPTGQYLDQGTNSISTTAVNALFATAAYGANAAGSAQKTLLGFNSDGTLFSRGLFNSPIDVRNFRYDLNGAAAPNLRFFPDFYSYNFDAVNLLVLPYERKSFTARANYEIFPGWSIYAQAMYTAYTSATALAPTPLGPTQAGPGNTNTQRNTDVLLTPGKTVTGLVVPITNPFIPTDLKNLLATRTGDNPNIVGAGATEPFLISTRTLPVGLRQFNTDNTVVQYLVGIDGDLGGDWSVHAYISEGKTKAQTNSQGGIDVSKVQNLLQAADGGNAICAGGMNPFGINALSPACITYISATGVVQQTYTQQIAQAYVTGPIATLPAGNIDLVVGGEHRYFKYDFPPSVLNGPVVGPNTQAAAKGTNSFTDFFAEASIPIVADASWAKNLELTVGYRYSESQFIDIQNNIEGDTQGDSAYKADLKWEVNDYATLRGSYNHAVRAPNFGELFNGGNSFTQYFDPCSVGTAARTAGGLPFQALCVATGIGGPAGSATAPIASFVANPGGQYELDANGNTNLKPETADTYTVGVVLSSPWKDDPIFGSARLTVDYYNIRIKDVISIDDPNSFVADCFNYYGRNPTFSAAYSSCQGIIRSGGQLALVGQGTNASNFTVVNQGTLETDGIDAQFDLNFDMSALGLGADSGSFAMNLLMTYVNSYKTSGGTFPDTEQAGTIPFFGQGLGQAFPEFKFTLNAAYTWNDLTLRTRVRYIDAMSNKGNLLFPGEPGQFTGVPATYYADFSLDYQVLENLGITVGVNNAFDQEPRTYNPNIQSGTDPSTYDVIGRRYFVQTKVRF